jgi:DNA primase catalytic core
MKNKLANLDEVIKKLRSFLPQYLTEHNIDVENNFSCLNPKHDDGNPSMSCNKNPENAYCFSCGVTCDIFQAAHWLEDKPISGPGFIEENVQYLAEKFGVEVELEEMTEDELYRYRTYRAYAAAADIVMNPEFGDQTKLTEEIEKRGWSSELNKAGTVEYKEFRDTLKAMGYEAGFQNEIDLGRPDIFNENNMIFTIKDEWGRPVGFAARNLMYDGQSGSKYTNQRTTGLRCNIYQKGRRLYEVHTAVKYTPPLYIFEGYTDVLTAQNAGLFNCAGIGGSAFTAQHVELLKQLGVYNIILVLDGDKAGRDKMEDLLDNYFCGHRDLQIELINLPEGTDPDDFIRDKGLEEFLALQKWGAFQWRLNRYSDEDNPEEICKIMIPLIVNEPSRITQDKMCGDLALFTGIEKKVITSELERLQNEKERQKHREKEVVMDQMVSRSRQNPSDIKNYLLEAVGKIEQIEDKYDENTFSLENVLQFVEGQKIYEEGLSGEFAGFNLSESGLKGLGDKLNGNWREDSFLCFGGKENTGKSSLCCQLAYEIATGKDNNACVIYHSIDDSKEQILPRFICQAYGSHDLTMNQIRNPNYFLKYEDQGTAYAQRRKMGYQELFNLIKDGRIIIKDVNDGASFAFGENLIKYYQKKYPDRNIVYFLDNLHKAPDFNNLEPRMRFKGLSNRVKDTATRHHVCIVATVEYTKLPPGVIPHNGNIAETRALMYDANFIGHLYNDVHERGQGAICMHRHENQVLPRLRLGIGKNKITEFKGRVFLDFFPASGMFKYIPSDTAEDDMRQRMQEIGAQSRSARNASHYGGNDGDSPQMPD